MLDKPYSPMDEENCEDCLDCCDEQTKKFLQENHDKWTIEQMEAIDRYVNYKRSKLQEAAEEEVTIEDFEKKKKGDIDNDNEEGE